MPFRVHDGQSLILFWKAVELCLVIGCGDSDPTTSDLVIPALDISNKIVCRANYSAERMDCKNSVYSLDLFLSFGPTQNENKVQKRHFIHGF